MKKSNIKTAKDSLKIKTGSVQNFFADVGAVMQMADNKKSIKLKPRTITFEDPTDMLYFLSAVKIKLINTIRKKPDSITNLAKTMHRNISAVARDVNELEKVGIVQAHSVVNPGHGRCKIIELTATKLTLEAYI